MITSRIKKIVGLIVFLCIIGTGYVKTTYLFRNNNDQRQRINGIKNEDALDVVCIGGSSTFVYWEPFLAWNEYGITSYNYATSSARPAIMKGYVKEVVKRVNPDLIVIDTRSYANGAIDVEKLEDAESGIRNMTDSLDLDMNRMTTLNDVMKFYDAFNDDSVDPWSFYFDIAKYHSNYEQLGEKDNWNHLSNDNFVSPYKGFEFITFEYHDFLDEPVNSKTNVKMDLSPAVKESLTDLLEYLHENDINALFVATPSQVSKDTQSCYNYIGETVQEYGYNFLNANDYYDVMGIDFKKDFYNSGHVNVFGAEKYTRFLADYIKDNYEVGDHRGNQEYSSWNDYFDAAHEQDVLLKNTIEKKIEEKNVAYKKGTRLKNVDIFDEWVKESYDRNYTIIVVSKGQVPDISLPWENVSGNSNIIRVFKADIVKAEFDSEQAEDYTSTIGTHDIPIVVNSGSKAKAMIADVEIPMNSEGVYFIAFDNNFNEVLDCIYVDGENEMTHVFQ